MAWISLSAPIINNCPVQIHPRDGLLIPFTYRFDPDEFNRMLRSNPRFIKRETEKDLKQLIFLGEVTNSSIKSERYPGQRPSS